jgi:hypothetical protein
MEIDGWLKKRYFLLSKDRLVNIYICNQISKYRKRDGYESIFV